MPDSLPVQSGFTVTKFLHPYKVDLFPNSDSFNPARGWAVGEELNNMFGSKRLIVNPMTPITRKVTNQSAQWPENTLYLSARDVEGWKSSGS